MTFFSDLLTHLGQFLEADTTVSTFDAFSLDPENSTEKTIGSLIVANSLQKTENFFSFQVSASLRRPDQSALSSGLFNDDAREYFLNRSRYVIDGEVLAQKVTLEVPTGEFLRGLGLSAEEFKSEQSLC